MPCYKPIVAFKPLDGGPIFFSEKKNCKEIEIPCGKCIGCRLRRQDEWAVRCMLEAQMHKSNRFITFTYDDDHMPTDTGLHYEHIQLLHKKMRQKYGPFRFFVAGEYGDESKRPHYHGLYFGLDIPDLVKCNSVYSTSDLYTSESLGKMWGQGFHTIGEVTYSSARYCAAYAVKKVTGDAADAHYERVHLHSGEIVKVEPEFAKMSLKPGLAEEWLRKYWKDVYSVHNCVYINDQRKPIPRYFDKLMDRWYPFFLEGNKFDRQKEAEKFIDNNTRERREVREIVAKSKQKFNKERRLGNAL